MQENGVVKAGLPERRTLAVGGTTAASAVVRTSSSQDPDAAGFVPKAHPAQRRPEGAGLSKSAGFVSSASLTATLLRTATNLSATAVTENPQCFKFTVTEACGKDSLGTTLADFPPCLAFLPEPLQSRRDGHRVWPRLRATDRGCALSKLYLHDNALRVTVILIRGEARRSERPAVHSSSRQLVTWKESASQHLIQTPTLK